MRSKKECGVPIIEDIIHILFDRTLYSEEMATYLEPYLKSKKNIATPRKNCLTYFLVGINLHITSKIAVFISKMKRIDWDWSESDVTDYRNDMEKDATLDVQMKLAHVLIIKRVQLKEWPG